MQSLLCLHNIMTNTIYISGSIAFDHLMTTQLSLRGLSFPEHGVATHSILSDTLFKNDGGTAANIAHSLTLIGIKSTLIGAVGDDAHQYLDRLSKRGIDTSNITVVADLPTAHASALTDSVGNQIFFFCPGAMNVPARYPSTSARFAIIAPGNHADMYTLPGIYRALSTPFIFDPGQMIHSLSPDALIEGMTGAHTLIMNEFEWGEYARKLGMTLDEVLMRVSRVVVTRGERGATLYTAENEIHVDAVEVHAEDTMGAGDAFRAGYLYGLCAEVPLTTALQVGCTLSSFCVEVSGTQTHHPSFDEIRARFETTYKQTFPQYTTQ